MGWILAFHPHGLNRVSWRQFLGWSRDLCGDAGIPVHLIHLILPVESYQVRGKRVSSELKCMDPEERDTGTETRLLSTPLRKYPKQAAWDMGSPLEEYKYGWQGKSA